VKGLGNVQVDAPTMIIDITGVDDGMRVWVYLRKWWRLWRSSTKIVSSFSSLP